MGSDLDDLDDADFAGVDADSIVDERNRYARVKATMPAEIETQSSASRL